MLLLFSRKIGLPILAQIKNNIDANMAENRLITMKVVG